MTQSSKLGVRSYANALLIANLYVNIPRKDMTIHRFAKKVLNPIVAVSSLDCGTVIGSKISTEEDVTGLIALDTDRPITQEYLNALYVQGIYDVRVRDTTSCTNARGVCAKCYRGYLVRLEKSTNLDFDATSSPNVLTNPKEHVGKTVTLSGNPVAFQRYVANTYSGSLVGVSPVPFGDLPVKSGSWNNIVNHSEMDGICDRLSLLGISSDELEYCRSVKDILERALIIIAYYGVYGSVSN